MLTSAHAHSSALLVAILEQHLETREPRKRPPGGSLFAKKTARGVQLAIPSRCIKERLRLRLRSVLRLWPSAFPYQKRKSLEIRKRLGEIAGYYVVDTSLEVQFIFAIEHFSSPQSWPKQQSCSAPNGATKAKAK